MIFPYLLPPFLLPPLQPPPPFPHPTSPIMFHNLTMPDGRHTCWDISSLCCSSEVFQLSQVVGKVMSERCSWCYQRRGSLWNVTIISVQLWNRETRSYRPRNRVNDRAETCSEKNTLRVILRGFGGKQWCCLKHYNYTIQINIIEHWTFRVDWVCRSRVVYCTESSASDTQYHYILSDLLNE